MMLQICYIGNSPTSKLENQEGDAWFGDFEAWIFSGLRLWKREMEEKAVEGGSQCFG